MAKNMQDFNMAEYNIPDYDLFVKRTLSPYFRNLPLLHITIRLHLIWRLLKFMQWLARKQYLLRRRTRQIRLNAVGRVKVGDNVIDL